MEVEIRNRPSFATLHVRLGRGDRIIAEADAMASMTSAVAMSTRFNGGPITGVLRRVLGGESMFVNEFYAESAAELVLTQALPGDIECVELRDEVLYLQPGAFVACEPDVNLGLGWAGFASFVGREGLFRLKLSGTGRVWIGAYGAIVTREIDREYIVDTGHLVGYEPTVGMRIGMSGGIFSSFFSGEGLVSRLTGPGRVYLQTRSLGGLAAWTNAHIRY